MELTTTTKHMPRNNSKKRRQSLSWQYPKKALLWQYDSRLERGGMRYPGMLIQLPSCSELNASLRIGPEAEAPDESAYSFLKD